MAEEEMPMQEDEISEETSESTPLENQTIFVPKQGEGYSIPGSGRAMVSFQKVSEDEDGCTLKVVNFETEAGEEITEDMDTRDHIDSFLSNREGESYV